MVSVLNLPTLIDQFLPILSFSFLPLVLSRKKKTLKDWLIPMSIF